MVMMINDDNDHNDDDEDDRNDEDALISECQCQYTGGVRRRAGSSFISIMARGAGE